MLDQGWEEEAEHTRYALLLVRASNGSDADSIREELQSFLHKSSFYDPAGVLAEIQEKAPHLLAEQVTTFGIYVFGKILRGGNFFKNVWE